jgi:hypothetical protein
MSVTETVKAAGSVVVEVIKANPLVAAGVAVAAVATGYGAKRYLAHRSAVKAALPAPVLKYTDEQLLAMNINQAKEKSVVAEWMNAACAAVAADANAVVEKKVG